MVPLAMMHGNNCNRTCSMCITCGTSSTNSPSSTSRTSSTSSKALAVLTLQNTEVYVCVRQCVCFQWFQNAFADQSPEHFTAIHLDLHCICLAIHLDLHCICWRSMFEARRSSMLRFLQELTERSQNSRVHSSILQHVRCVQWGRQIP